MKIRETAGITAYWVQEDGEKNVEKPQRYVQIGRLLMPLIGPDKPESFKRYRMPSGDLESFAA